MVQQNELGKPHGDDWFYDGLPVVSIIITNFNYDRFIGEALASIAAQTYPNIEIVVVDDLSTDESWNTIVKLTGPSGSYPHARAFRMPVNSGHSLSAAEGLAHTSGSYVIFMDADDVLLPTCVEAHVFAHLSTRIPVGFTSVDVFCCCLGKWVTSTFGVDRAKYIAAPKEQNLDMIRPIVDVVPAWLSAMQPLALRADEMHIVPAPVCEWLWAPMSGNCFRRDAVEHFLTGPDLVHIRCGVDAYLMQPVASLYGSLLIDRPLMNYRIHQSNSFIKSAPLSRTRVYDVKVDPRPAAKRGVRRTFALVKQRGDFFEEPDFFFQSVANQCRVWPGLEAERGGTDFLTECLCEYEDMLTHAFGRAKVSEWMTRCGVYASESKPSFSRRGWPVSSWAKKVAARQDDKRGRHLTPEIE